MKFTEYLSLYYMKRASAATLFVVMILLVVHYHLIDLSIRLPFSQYIPWITIFWIYLLLNAGIATPLHYWYESKKKAPICPNCNKKLKINYTYECTECGVLKFDKREFMRKKI